MSGFCSTALIACFVLGGSNAFAQTSYRAIDVGQTRYGVKDLGVLPGKEESVPAAINGQGLVAGTSRANASGEAAFRYNPNNPAPMEDIGQSIRGIINRKRLRVRSTQCAQIYHSRGFTPVERAAFWTVQARTRETDYLVEAVDAIRAAEGLPFQSSQIHDFSVVEHGGMPDGRNRGERGHEHRIANHQAAIVDTEAAATRTAKAQPYVLHQGRVKGVVTKRGLTRGFRA